MFRGNDDDTIIDDPTGLNFQVLQAYAWDDTLLDDIAVYFPYYSGPST